MVQFGKSKSLLKIIPRKKFDYLCVQWNMDYRSRRLSTWDRMAANVMSQLMRLEALREIESVLGVPRSTLSDANRHRPAEFFHALCRAIVQEIRQRRGNRSTKRM